MEREGKAVGWDCEIAKKAVGGVGNSGVAILSHAEPQRFTEVAENGRGNVPVASLRSE